MSYKIYSYEFGKGRVEQRMLSLSQADMGSGDARERVERLWAESMDGKIKWALLQNPKHPLLQTAISDMADTIQNHLAFLSKTSYILTSQSDFPAPAYRIRGIFGVLKLALTHKQENDSIIKVFHRSGKITEVESDYNRDLDLELWGIE